MTTKETFEQSKQELENAIKKFALENKDMSIDFVFVPHSDEDNGIIQSLYNYSISTNVYSAMSLIDQVFIDCKDRPDFMRMIYTNFIIQIKNTFERVNQDHANTQNKH